jgi:hypothetical protein
MIQQMKSSKSEERFEEKIKNLKMTAKTSGIIKKN